MILVPTLAFAQFLFTDACAALTYVHYNVLFARSVKQSEVRRLVWTYSQNENPSQYILCLLFVRAGTKFGKKNH